LAMILRRFFVLYGQRAFCMIRSSIMTAKEDQRKEETNRNAQLHHKPANKRLVSA